MSKPQRPQRPRIVHITTVPFTLTFLQGQPRFMRQAGFEWSAISSPGDQLDDFAHRQRAPVHAIRLTRRITPVRDLLALVKLWRYLRRVRPQIVQAHTPKAGLLGMLAAGLARVPVRIYQLHGLPWVTAGGLRRRLLIGSERLSCQLAHQVLAVSRSIREVAVNVGLGDPSKIKVLRQGTANGVDALGRFDPRRHASQRLPLRQRLGIPARATVLGFVGRLVTDKGLVELLQAWSRLRVEYPDLQLLMVGPLEAEHPLPASVQQQLSQDLRIHLLGFQRDPAPLYAAMDLVLLPTYREGFPTVPLEAAAMGLPVVATRVPGCVDAVVDGVTGQLIPPRCAESLVAAVRTYLQEPSLRRRHGQAGRERVLRDFQPAAIWDALRHEYIRLLRQRGWPESRPAPRDRRAAA